ncbi:PhoX family phosphatase [Thauera sp. CAU 1555]|uniref:PhoX family phosphatase n=1 Tax=Thauera sedimentorum TaxID=2767595 RepID=A0ABR9B4Y9_9RHOO|nr:PhoX family phosphatase [Thauera sedimentorum]MBD8501453.1 PhoX family phosphatase [Thauera sedimentorum]
MSKPESADVLPCNLSDNEHFQQVVDRVVSRRGFLKSSLGLSAAVFLAGPLAACGGGDSDDDDEQKGPRIGFKAVAASTADAIVVPEGYSYQVLAPWGSALFVDSPAWRTDGTNTAAEQARQVGDNHDGMHFFPIDGQSSNEGLLVVNHEYVNPEYLYGAEFMTPWTVEKANKALAAHGVSVLHIVRNAAGKWEVKLDSSYNRRITGTTPMTLSGPVAGSDLVKTGADSSGMTVLGTLNNCANGYTPWGTYLTCEENFNGYFGTTSSDEAALTPALRRYGFAKDGFGYRWHEVIDRFDYAKEPNEGNRFGWVVEIDPFDPDSTPVKHTALGRFKHENAAYAIADDGRLVVYMGDDERFDYIYKFVSDGVYVPAQGKANSALLSAGKLYVARFEAGSAAGDMMGAGQWLLLDKSNPLLAGDADLPTQADVLTYARIAADKVGATKMDRPEWIAVHPETGEVYCCLTNNSRRTEAQIDDANPRAGNDYGQIIRWREAGGAAADSFDWDLFVLAGNPVAVPDRKDLRSGSSNINADNTFNSPDGLAFDQDGRLWIQTDGNYSNAGKYAGQGNNQVLCANPATGEIRRFAVGPKACEITGLSFTPDGRTLFINIQHPGEAGSNPEEVAMNPLSVSTWPDAAGGRPRSATVVITRNDGGVIGA